MEILNEASLPFQSMCLIQIFLKIDENSLRSIPPLPKHVSRILFETDILSEASLLFQSMFLIQSYKIDENHLRISLD